MYQGNLLVILILSIMFLNKHEVKSIKTKLQAIITPFGKSINKEFNSLNDVLISGNHIQNQNNIKAKQIFITMWLKKHTQVFYNCVKFLP